MNIQNISSKIENTFLSKDQIFFENESVKVVEDLDRKLINGYNVRLFKVLYKKELHEIGIRRYDNLGRECLAFSMYNPKGQFSNILQYVFKRHLEIENKSIDFYHNAVLGGGVKGLTKKRMIDLVKENGSNSLIVENDSKILIGTLQDISSIDWGNIKYRTLIANFVEFSILIRKVKDEIMEKKS